MSLALSIPQNTLRAPQDEAVKGLYTLTLTLSQGERGFYALTREQGECELSQAVMAGLDPAIHVDTRVKPAHDVYFGAPRSNCSPSLLRQAQDEGARARMRVVS